MRKFIYFILIVIILITTMSCSNKNISRFEAQFLDVFDTASIIVGYAENKEDFSKQANMIHEDLQKYHKLYDVYNNYEGISNIKTINDNAGIRPVKVDKRIVDLLIYSKKIYETTNGKINIALGSVLSIWHNYREEGTYDSKKARLPEIEILKEASNHTDIEKVVINKENSTVYIVDPKLKLDVGAVAKGYAVEQVGKLAKTRGFTNGIISIGGNVKTIGTKPPDGELWNVGVKNPDPKRVSENQNLLIVSLDSKSLVTSGSYSRYYTVNGKEYSHIIDPATLYPAEYFESVTIISNSSTLADAISTALFTLPYDKGIALIEKIDDAEAFWYYKDKRRKYSSGFEKYIRD